jgi:hypothetical protein
MRFNNSAIPIAGRTPFRAAARYLNLDGESFCISALTSYLMLHWLTRIENITS